VRELLEFSVDAGVYRTVTEGNIHSFRYTDIERGTLTLEISCDVAVYFVCIFTSNSDRIRSGVRVVSGGEIARRPRQGGADFSPHFKARSDSVCSSVSIYQLLKAELTNRGPVTRLD
jgi:hypothetical protein